MFIRRIFDDVQKISKCLRQTATRQGHQCKFKHSCNQATEQPSNQASHQKSVKKSTNNEFKLCKKSTKMVSKIHQVGSKNPPSWSPKYSKTDTLGSLGGVWGPSWAILDHLGPKMVPKAHKDLQKLIVGPPLDPPSWSQNRPKIDQEPTQNLITFLIGCWIGL